MDITDHPSVLARTSDVYGLNSGTATNMTGECMMCALNLF